MCTDSAELFRDRDEPASRPGKGPRGRRAGTGDRGTAGTGVGAARLEPKVRPGARRAGNSTCRVGAAATNRQRSGSLGREERGAARPLGPPAPSPRARRPPAPPGPRPRTPTRPAPKAPAPLAPPALAHLRPRGVLESRAEAPGAACGPARPLALHGPGGRAAQAIAAGPGRGAGLVPVSGPALRPQRLCRALPVAHR